MLARMDHFTTPGNERVMVTHVPVHGTPTFYARFGDVFSWGCVVGLAALACLGVAPAPGNFWQSDSPDVGRTREALIVKMQNDTLVVT